MSTARWPLRTPGKLKLRLMPAIKMGCTPGTGTMKTTKYSTTSFHHPISPAHDAIFLIIALAVYHTLNKLHPEYTRSIDSTTFTRRHHGLYFPFRQHILSPERAQQLPLQRQKGLPSRFDRCLHLLPFLRIIRHPASQEGQITAYKPILRHLGLDVPEPRMGRPHRIHGAHQNRAPRAPNPLPPLQLRLPELHGAAPDRAARAAGQAAQAGQQAHP